jgi:hypothetical protein
VVDDVGAAADGIQIDAVARADDRAIREIVDGGGAGAIIATGSRTGVLADDLAMIVEDGIAAGPNGI